MSASWRDETAPGPCALLGGPGGTRCRRMRNLTLLRDLVRGAGMTGAARTRRPVYVDLLPPCNGGCPAGENIQAWLAAARDGSSSGPGAC
jgi:hypothetical protein